MLNKKKAMVRSIFFSPKNVEKPLQSKGLSINLKKAMFHNPLSRISVAIEAKKDGLQVKSWSGKSGETLRSELIMKYI